MNHHSVIKGSSNPRKPRAKVYDARTSPVEMLRHRRAWRVGLGRFEVISRNGRTRYTLRIGADGNLTCPCRAGRFGTPCWHAVKVLMRLLREGVHE